LAEAVTFETVSFTPVLFVSLMERAGLLVFTVWLAKVTLAGANVTLALDPVPVKVALCGEFDALSVTTTVPVRVPVTMGVKAMLMVHVPPAATDVPQLLV
jgi:hypothetical protein